MLMASSQLANRWAQIRTARVISSLNTMKVSFHAISSLGPCLTRPSQFPFLCVGEMDKCIVYVFFSQAQFHVFTHLHRDRYRDTVLKLCSFSKQTFP